jgi:cell division protein FtsQ
VVSAMPAVTQGDDEAEDSGRVPRRTKFVVARTPWWRPRSTFGRVLLGTAAFLVLAGAVTVGIVVRSFLTHDRHFRIPGASSIQSSGLSEVNRAEVLPVFGEDIGRNIFFVPLSERRKQLEAIPWVQQATVMRFLPDRLSVSIVERTPVAFVRQGSQVELADADGVILSMPPAMMAQHHYSFPVVTGIDSKDSLASRRTRMAVYQRFLSELDQNNQHLTEQVSEIDLSDPEDLRAVMPEQGSDILVHFGEDQFLRRLQIYKTHIAEWRGRYPKLIGVDLRYNGEVPLEMATDGAGTGASAARISVIGPSSPEDLKPVVQTTKAKNDKANTAVATGKPETTKSETAKPETAKSETAKSETTRPATAKAASVKTVALAHKAAEARKKAARLKAAKAKAAHDKSTAHSAHNTTQPASAVKQGQ